MTENEIQLLDLVGKLSLFVNGGSDEYVTTDNGQIPTLAAIANRAKSTKYVVEAIGFPTKNSLELAVDNESFVGGQIARVYRDPLEENNGFYQIDPVNPNAILKTDLIDLYGLGPKEFGSTMAVIGADDIGKKSLMKFKFIASPIDPFIQQIRYEIDVKCRKSGNRFLRTYIGTLLLSYDSTSGLLQSKVTDSTNTLLIDSTASPSDELVLTASIDPSSSGSTILNLKLMSTNLPGFDFTGYVVKVKLSNLSKDSYINS